MDNQIRIMDTHMHIVPHVDDGARDLNMSLEMLRMAYDQGVRSIFCTSHSGYSFRDQQNYLQNFELLKTHAQPLFPDLLLFPGCELLCESDEKDHILERLHTKIYSSMNNTRFVLTEYYTDTDENEVFDVTDALLSAGWNPIIAHAERYPNLFHGRTISKLIDMGCRLQINLFSLNNEMSSQSQNNARYLLENHLVHFVGSDAHRTTHRPPAVSNGVEYILSNCSREYTAQILYENAENLLSISKP